jgi:hypothetical protein
MTRAKIHNLAKDSEFNEFHLESSAAHQNLIDPEFYHDISDFWNTLVGSQQ